MDHLECKVYVASLLNQEGFYDAISLAMMCSKLTPMVFWIALLFISFLFFPFKGFFEDSIQAFAKPKILHGLLLFV
jgi:hypothetical protein